MNTINRFRGRSLMMILLDIYGKMRRWRYSLSPGAAELLEFAEFAEQSRLFINRSGIEQLLINSQGIFVRVKQGFFLWFNPAKKHGKLWGMEKTGEWEPEVMAHCIAKIKQGGTFFDVGANVGVFSLSVLSALESTVNFSIHAFEPIPDNFNVLKMNVNVNNASDSISLNNLAVGGENIKIAMRINGQLSNVDENLIVNIDDTNRVLVDMITLDYYCAVNNITDVKLIKCDVEGFELNVLRGAENLLREQQPVIVIELEDRWMLKYGNDKYAIFDFLEKLGYRKIPIQRNSNDSELCETNMYLFEIE